MTTITRKKPKTEEVRLIKKIEAELRKKEEERKEKRGSQPQKIIETDSLLIFFNLIKEIAETNNKLKEKLIGIKLTLQIIINHQMFRRKSRLYGFFGPKSRKYWVDIRDGTFTHGTGDIEKPTVSLSTTYEIGLAILFGRLDIINLKNYISVKGNVQDLITLQEISEFIFNLFENFDEIIGKLKNIISNQVNIGESVINDFKLRIREKNERERKEKWRKELKPKLREERERKEREKKENEQKLREEREKKEGEEKELEQKLREEKERKERRRKELERIFKEEKETYSELVQHINNLTTIYKEIKIKDVENKLPHALKSNYRTTLKKDLTSLIEEMIIKKDINARIRGEYLTFIKEDLKERTDLNREIVESNQLITKEITILRGGDWKIEENQSVFYFKIKVRNNSKFVLSNIQILLTSIPPGLIPHSDRYRIENLNPNSFESPTFKFTAKDSCVGDNIKGMVLFTDYMGNQQTIPIKPFKIEYVCNLLVPKSITEEVYEKNTAIMQERKIIFDCDLTPDKLESEVAQILKQNNFYILKSPQESEKQDFRKIKAYAEGKYDSQDVALSIIMQKLTDQANKLIIKAMSNRQEKIIDLLKDISKKCDPLKSASKDSIPIEFICKNCENTIIITKYMKMKEIIICEDCGEENEIPK